jgi:hypothetical protein
MNNTVLAKPDIKNTFYIPSPLGITLVESAEVSELRWRAYLWGYLPHTAHSVTSEPWNSSPFRLSEVSLAQNYGAYTSQPMSVF